MEGVLVHRSYATETYLLVFVTIVAHRWVSSEKEIIFIYALMGLSLAVSRFEFYLVEMLSP